MPDTSGDTTQEAARAEAARQEAERQAAARLAAEQAEAQRQAAARQEAARAEAARQEAERQAAAKLAAEQAEAQRQAAARQEAAQAEAARAEAARAQAERNEDERREARRRAMGRILDEEAAQRAAADRLPPSQGMSRRIRLWGRTDSNAELVKYVEAWERRIQFNTPVDVVHNVASQPHVNPMVIVAVRSNGTIESVTFFTSSGVPAVDEAIRQIINRLVPYQAFPPALARDYDVVEIRRTWSFDVAVRLY